ncbi:DUF4142 domain-containing protein [Planosporangium thailandense]|uniref:DUF4142 domain-containing protein n=1 Tax=Planosporangium thailandense TaxID=765197 RepID=A0ABX0XYP3_9ACTN|nr:DUF4142 domain-containing protein [Planosporangium thailandense]NJC71176.1 DUF4142 domain-containing protein [Planosporangium thailandense]
MRVRLATGMVAAVCAAVTSLPAAALAAPAQTPSPGGPSPSGPLNSHERMFLTEASRDAQFEIAAGHLAANRAASAAVRSFGQRMVTDHTKQAQALQHLDSSFGITAPSAPGADEQNLLKIWSSVRGGPFDCSYAPAMYPMHVLDLHMYAIVAKRASNAQVRQFAASQVPVLRQHLQLAHKNLSNLNCSAPPHTAARS